MVCSLGSGRMAVMARLLAAGGLLESSAEDVNQQKLVAKYINRELREADEANLLDEEDMHVFGLMPMTDPLHLVCCNACKKPVKASQYVAHAELCRSLNSAELMTLEPNGGIRRKKPPRKERKKSLTAYTNRKTPAKEQGRSAATDVDDTAASESQFHWQPRMPSSFTMDTKRNSASIDVASMMDGKGLSRESKDPSACVVSPPTKRSKLKSSPRQLLSDDPETASGLTKLTSSLDPFTTGRDFQLQSTSESDLPKESIPKHTELTQEHCQPTKDIPVPLATKIYYSQRNSRFRSALAHLYHAASAKGICSSMVSPEQSWETTRKIQASRDSSHGLRGPFAHIPDQIVAQSSDSCKEKSGGSPPITNFSNQNPVNDILRPQTAAAELLRSKYISKPHSFAGNSGQSLGTMQQPNGTVPVL